MFCSIIMPTIGRPSLGRAVDSVLEQEFDAAPFELIVVNDSGAPLPVAAWHTEARVTIIDTNRRNRSVARNTGAAVARGAYLCFLDDDDWWLPGALDHFWQLAQRAPGAAWLYGGVTFVDPDGRHLGNLHLRKEGNCFGEAIAAVWIPLQASLIAAHSFFAAGGFAPTLSVTEDLDVCRKVALTGEFAYTAATVTAVLRGGFWASSTPPGQVAAASRQGRDRLLAQPGAWSRLKENATGSSFYHGRLLHAYLSAALLNLRQRRYGQALSRAAFGLLSLVSAGGHLLRPAYWQALRTDTLTHLLITEASDAYDSVAEWLY